MINLEVNNWYEAWVAIHKRYASQPELTIDGRFVHRAVSFNNDIYIDTNKLGGLKKELVGYSDYKMKLFDTNYVIPGMMEKIGDKLVERVNANKKLTVISYPFNILNESHDQGPCVINILILLRKTGKEWIIEYKPNMRIGEITKRLLIDFIKFQQIIEYWNDRLKHLKVKHILTTFHCEVLYAQSLFTIIVENLPGLDIKYDKEHWFHQTVRQQYKKFENPNYAMKMGKRVNKHVLKLKENANVEN